MVHGWQIVLDLSYLQYAVCHMITCDKNPVTKSLCDKITSNCEIIDVIEDREMWQFNFKLLPPQSSRKSWQ